MLVGQEPGIDRFSVALAFEALGELLASFSGVVGRFCLRRLTDCVLPAGAGNGASHHFFSSRGHGLGPFTFCVRACLLYPGEG